MSPLKIRGTIDDLSFRLTDDGIVVQSKPGPTREQVRTGKNFDLTRRNAREFGRATKDAMLLRRALGWLVRAVKHSKLNSHMNKRLHQIAKSDTVSTYGSRHADGGNIQLLEGFDYNHLSSLDAALPIRLEHAMNTSTGAMQLNVPSCIVRRKKNLFPAAATHFRIVSCVGSVDFNQQRFSSNIAESELLPLSKKISAFQLEHSIQTQPGRVMLHTVGIVFYKVEDGEETLLRGGALKIVQVARKEEVVEVPGTGTPAHTALPRTCTSDERDQLVTAGVTDARGLPLRGGETKSNARETSKSPDKRTRLRDYCGKQLKLPT